MATASRAAPDVVDDKPSALITSHVLQLLKAFGKTKLQDLYNGVDGNNKLKPFASPGELTEFTKLSPTIAERLLPILKRFTKNSSNATAEWTDDHIAELML